MLTFKRILCPVDLSERSLASIELATSFAKAHDATVVFIYVAPYWQPDETLIDAHYIRDSMNADKNEFMKLRPNDDSVRFEHLFLMGNPGPEIVSASKKCDMIVMSTHGHTGFVRLLVGSVAEYVMRHAECPVITFKPSKVKKMKATAKTPDLKSANADGSPNTQPDFQPSQSNEVPFSAPHFVTRLMQHVSPIHSYQNMEEVIAELDRAKQTGAPVIDEEGRCVGILTQSDIQRYRDLQERYNARDESVIPEMFEVDEFGQRRAGSCNFDQVCKHLTAPARSVTNKESVDAAKKLFNEHTDIHHLVVVDEWNHPIGVLRAQDLPQQKATAPR